MTFIENGITVKALSCASDYLEVFKGSEEGIPKTGVDVTWCQIIAWYGECFLN